LRGLRCAALTKKATRCKKICERGHGLCSVHRPMFNFQVTSYEQRFSPTRKKISGKNSEE
jgi:hypothetical protein